MSDPMRLLVVDDERRFLETLTGRLQLRGFDVVATTCGEVLARIEAGAGAGVHTDLLDLRDRALELFKVVSRDGRPEVWLLGQPLLALTAK